MGKNRKNRNPINLDDPILLFHVCDWLIMQKLSTKEIAEKLEEQGYAVTREKIYPLFSLAEEKGILTICPPVEEELSRALSYKWFGEEPDRIRVVIPQVDDDVNRRVAMAGAKLVFDLILKLWNDNKGKQEVHLALGAGWTSSMCAKYIARRYRTLRAGPKLVLHALSTGIFDTHPMDAPVAQFSFFEDCLLPVEYVGLFGPVVVPCKDYKKQCEMEGAKTAFERKNEIDIVMSSLGTRNDQHPTFNRIMQKHGLKDLKALEQNNWVGDIQYRPFAAREPLQEKGVRMMTLFEIDDFINLAKQHPSKSVVVLTGPCSVKDCNQTKETGLIPLLNQRVLSHLVVDHETAKALLEQ